MNLKVHFFMTLSALLFLGVIVAKPDVLQKEEVRSCKMSAGSMNCTSRFSENRIRYSVPEIEYRIN